MSKKVTKSDYTHSQCRHCRPYTEGFLKVGTHEAVLGSCEYEEFLFPLNEKINCENFKKR